VELKMTGGISGDAIHVTDGYPAARWMTAHAGIPAPRAKEETGARFIDVVPQWSHEQPAVRHYLQLPLDIQRYFRKGCSHGIE
jgi:hypothetical protein